MRVQVLARPAGVHHAAYLRLSPQLLHLLPEDAPEHDEEDGSADEDHDRRRSGER